MLQPFVFYVVLTCVWLIRWSRDSFLSPYILTSEHPMTIWAKLTRRFVADCIKQSNLYHVKALSVFSTINRLNLRLCSGVQDTSAAARGRHLGVCDRPAGSACTH